MRVCNPCCQCFHSTQFHSPLFHHLTPPTGALGDAPVPVAQAQVGSSPWYEVKCTDGRRYFFNHSTQATEWSMPPEVGGCVGWEVGWAGLDRQGLKQVVATQGEARQAGTVCVKSARCCRWPTSTHVLRSGLCADVSHSSLQHFLTMLCCCVLLPSFLHTHAYLPAYIHHRRCCCCYTITS